MLLTAALIVRDEAARLDGCLASLSGLVDDIVVVDTGSVDESVSIAERHGAHVVHDAWHDDFARARNHALDLVGSEWVLYVDADERVRDGDHALARDALADADGMLAGLVPFVPRVGWTPYREYRLWRNRPAIRFRGAMHETIVPAVTRVARREGLRVESFDLITIDHLGYEGDQRAKHDRDEPLLRAEIERSPDRSFLYDHLARVHEGRGESDLAVQAWRAGIERVRARRARRPDDLVLYVDLIFHLLARSEVTDELAELIAEALDRFERTPSIELAAARLEFATGRPAVAAERVEWILSLSDEVLLDSGNSYDRRIFGEWAFDLLGLCRFSLGDPQGAAEAFRRAEASAPSSPVYATRRRLAEARAGGRSSR